MKIKIIRASGNPVDPVKAQEKQEAWQSGFDAIIEEHGKYGEATNNALDALEKSLETTYNDLTVASVDFPKSGKAWKKLLSDYGNVMVTTVIEDGQHAKSGDILFVINDMPF